MIIQSATVIDLNPYEQAAAVRVHFPFNKYHARRIGRAEHIRVEFPNAAECAQWKKKIMDALPADSDFTGKRA